MGFSNISGHKVVLDLTFLSLCPSLLFLLPVQKRVSEWVKVAKWFFWIHRDGVPRNDSLLLSIHECSETISGWLWPNSAARELFL